MSWEETGSTDSSCSCGRSTYTVTSRSDDWGRSDEVWKMNCEDCRATHRLVTFAGRYKGTIPDLRHAWAPEQICVRADELEEAANSKRAEALALARETYYSRWARGLDRRSKKSLWTGLTGGGKRYPTLATFYAHTRNGKVDEYIRRHFDQNYREILKEEMTDDSQVEQLLLEADDLEAQARRMVRDSCVGGPGDMRKSGPVAPSW